METITDEMFQKLIEKFRVVTVQIEETYRANALVRQRKCRRIVGNPSTPRLEEELVKMEDRACERHITLLAERTRRFQDHLKRLGYRGVFLG